MGAESKAKKPKQPIPPWAWLFAVGCGILPVLTLGGAIPGAIGGGGAFSCIAVARNAEWPLAARIAICAGITCGCWVLVAVILGGMILFRG